MTRLIVVSALAGSLVTVLALTALTAYALNLDKRHIPNRSTP